MERFLMNILSKKRITTFTNSYELDLLVNQKEFPIINKKKGEDMYHKIKESFHPEMVDEFNVQSNIIIAGPENYNNIKRDEFGDLRINIDKKTDISNCKIINNHAVLYFFPKIKILFPKGVNVNFNIPNDINYVWKCYGNHTILHRHSTDAVIPDYHIYKQLVFIMYIDINQMKQSKNILTINNNTSLISMNFTPKYFIGAPEFTHIDNVYFVQNDEFVQNLDDIY